MTDSPDTPWTRYEQRIENTIAYIHSHLSEPLTSDTLAEVAHLSPYHWHRIYRAIAGESAAATVKRSRMHKAAADLLRTDKSIEEIGTSVGYAMHSFNRKFKDYYGTAPGQFRQANQPPRKDAANPARDAPTRYPVTVETKVDMHLIGYWHTGDFMDIGQTFSRAMAACQMHGLMPPNPVTAGVYYADPDITSLENLRSFAGVSVPPDASVPEGMEKVIYRGGRFATMTHQGPYALLNQSYQWLFGCWLPASSEAVRDQPCCEIYLNTPLDTDPADLLTAICLPIE
ncbi:MAG: AraC family transcriptional regulator [Pseudomonadota bacterium]